MNNEELNYTRFIPSPEPVSSIKKWIAHSEGFAKGELHINHCATELLFSDKAVSILPVGITDVIGEFEKDDIVRIIDFGGKPIGVSQYHPVAPCGQQHHSDKFCPNRVHL